MTRYADADMAGDPHAEYLALVDELTEHDRRYYVEANPTITHGHGRSA